MHMIAQKTRLRITLDLNVYEDLDVRNINWAEILELSGDESIDVSIENLDYDY
jgi:hypothetical protein